LIITISSLDLNKIIGLAPAPVNQCIFRQLHNRHDGR